jgi:methylthioribulose-1-phosphate dehydratase
VHRRFPGLAEVSAELASLSRFCYSKEWALATSGNFSARIGDDRIAITASGRDKCELSEGDIVVVDMQGCVTNSSLKASAETRLHCSLYRDRADALVVAHTHSIAATVLSRRYAGRIAIRFSGYEMQKAITGFCDHERTISIPVVSNSQDMQVLEESLSFALQSMPDAPAYLVAGHGLTTWATDFRSLKRQLEGLEFLFSCVMAESDLQR